MSKYIPEKLRIQVAERAQFRCEYCHRLEEDSFIRIENQCFTDTIFNRSFAQI